MSATQIRGSTQIIDGSIPTPKLLMTTDLDMATHKIVNLVDPVNPQDAATRAWVLANVAGGVVSSTTAKAATTANITLSGTQTVDGVALSSGDTCLVKNQSTPAQNGVYSVAGGAWTRIAAMDSWAEVPGMLVSVQQGTANSDTLWLSTADAGGTLGSTAITFVQVPGPSDIQAGAGLTRSGQVLDVVAGDNSMTINADNIVVKLDAAGAMSVGASGVKNNVDNATIEINANALRVKPGVFQQAANIIIRETPSGSINGSNVTFTLAATPVSGSEQIFLNGLLLESGAGNDYTISGGTITMLSAPVSGDRLKACYLK